MIKNKIMCVGVGLQEYYCICAIIGLLEKQFSEYSDGEEKKSANRVQQMIQRVLSLQDNYSAAATLASLPNMVSHYQDSNFLQKEALIDIVKQIATSTSLLLNGNSNANGHSTGNLDININGIGPSAHMDGTELLEVIRDFHRRFCDTLIMMVPRISVTI